MSQINGRYIALNICLAVIKDGRSLNQALSKHLNSLKDSRDKAFVQNLAFGTLRWQLRLQAIADQLMQKPLKAKDQDVNQLILLGLYQLIYMNTAEHAAVSETVQLTKKLKKPWAKGLINGILRNFLREVDEITEKVDDNPVVHYSHPQWLIEKLRKAYPDNWQNICEANNTPAPLTLRVNPLQISPDQFLEKLSEANVSAHPHPYSQYGIQLQQSIDITNLPGFDQGAFSVQDAAAQQAGYLLAPLPDEHILDACAAPGGKTTHLLELSANQSNVLALEIEEDRIQKLRDNLERLKLNAEVKVGDASHPESWWSGEKFDRILLDAPCSATGIIRRHPDIKWHRKPQDIKALVQTQADILKQLWSLLKPGGTLLYATCSILPEENALQMQTFLTENQDAQEKAIETDWGHSQETPGKQILPGMSDMDGFYYCLLEKMDKP